MTHLFCFSLLLDTASHFKYMMPVFLEGTGFGWLSILCYHIVNNAAVLLEAGDTSALFNALFGYKKIWVGMEEGESLFEEWGEMNQANVEEKLEEGDNPQYWWKQ